MPIVAVAVKAEKATVEPMTAALIAIASTATSRAALTGRWCLGVTRLQVLSKGPCHQRISSPPGRIVNLNE